MKNLIFSILTLSLSVTSVNAQLFDGIENILLTSTEDARILAEGYTAPIGKTLTYALNSGWATSAKTHKKLGFGLTIGGAAPFVPDVDQVFRFFIGDIVGTVSVFLFLTILLKPILRQAKNQ